MATKSVAVRDDAHWRQLRAKHVGGSEISCLFGEHAQLTEFELFHRKKGNVPEPDLSGNDRVFFGQLLEPAIAAGVAQKNPDWTVRKVRRYLSNPDIGIGGSPDYEIIGVPSRGPGILEIKTADWLIAKGWEDNTPPTSYLLQIQHYLSLTNWSWGCMAVLIGGNELRMFEYSRRDTTIKIIEDRVAEFWRNIRDGVEPKPDFAKDAGTISALYSSVSDGKTVDLSGSNRLPELIQTYRGASEQEKAAKDAKEASKAEILTLVGDAEVALCDGDRVSCRMVAGAHIAYDRKPYRSFHLSKPKV